MRLFGGPEVMQLEDIPTPEPQHNEVVIQVHAVSVNRTLDLALRSGRYARTVALPHVLGVDPSGIVSAVGEGVTDRQVGDRVVTKYRVSGGTAGEPARLLGVDLWGGYAEYVKIPAHATQRIPVGLDFPTATVVARHAPTAFFLLRERAKLQYGEWILIMGASGGLGSAGTQVARSLGAKIIVAAGADERVQAACALGADAGVNYRAQDLTDEVMRITEGRGVNVVFENVGDPEQFPKAVACLARNGRLVTAGAAQGGGIVSLDVNRLYLNNLTVLGATGEMPTDLATALEAAAAGQYKVLIDRVLPLSQAALAHEIVTQRSGVGKVLLDPTRI